MIQANSAAIPFILPLVAAVFMLFQERARLLPLVFLLLTLTFSGWLLFNTYSGTIFVTYVGGWLAPFGVTLLVDTFSSLMLVFSNLTFLLATIYSFSEKPPPFRLPLIFLLQAGVSLSFITADFFNLFVSFEIMLTASYALVLLEVEEKKREKTIAYVMINMVGSFLFLSAAAMAYGLTGNLNMAALHLSLAEIAGGPLSLCIGVAAIIIYGLKAGLFPFYFWLPDTYPLLPFSLAGLFGAVLTKVGVYVLIRLFVTVLPHSMHSLHMLLLIFAGLTMFLGVLGAMCQKTIKKILSYHILSQVGYMALGLGLFNPPALAAALLFIVHNIVVKSSLFWIGGEAARMEKSEELEKMEGLFATQPWLGFCFLVQALSLAGVPPLSGFWGKYLLFSSTLTAEHSVLLIVAVITSFWTLFSMIKIWTAVFFKEKQAKKAKKYQMSRMVTIVCCMAVSLVLGLGVEWAYQASIHAATELFNPALYVEAVLGGRR